MDLNFLPPKYVNVLSNVDISNLIEIRLRAGFPVVVNYSLKRAYLSEGGITILPSKGIICSFDDINTTLNNLTEYSIYAFNDMIKKGFLVYDGGVRIGLGGECVTENGQVQTIKNVSSLNVRIPHFVDNCARELFKYVYDCDGVKSSLIISPPLFGKTTMLKDIAKKLNDLNKYSILILDERGEFGSINGENVDKITYSDKLYGLKYGLRTLSPSVIITDELSTESDWQCVLEAVHSGVKIIASCHGKNICDLETKNNFNKRIFDRYLVLKEVGVLGEVFGGDFNRL